MILADAKSIKENSVKLGAGEDLYALFAGILTMKPWNRVVDPALDHLVIQGNDSERSELQVQLVDCLFYELDFCIKEFLLKKLFGYDIDNFLL